MARRRMIDEKIRSSQTFAALTYRQRDLWHGLIVEADDQGRLPGSPRFIRSRVWPTDEIGADEVEADLAALEAAGNISRYQVIGASYIQIINWWRYQQMQWAGPSDYPAPPNWVDRLRYHGRGNKIITQAWDEVGGYLPVQSNSVGSPLGRDVPSRVDTAQAYPIEEGEVNGEGEGESLGAPPAPGADAPKTQPARKGRLGADPRTKSSEIQLYRQLTGKYPHHTLYDEIIADIRGRSEDELKPFYAEWLRRGYNPNATSWLKWAVAGQVPSQQKPDSPPGRPNSRNGGGNGQHIRNGATNAPNTEELERDRKLRAQRDAGRAAGA